MNKMLQVIIATVGLSLSPTLGLCVSDNKPLSRDAALICAATQRAIQEFVDAHNHGAAKAVILECQKNGYALELTAIAKHACDRNQWEFITWLIEHTDLAFRYDYEGATLLRYAVINHNMKLLRTLLACKQVDIDAQLPEGGWTALMDAADQGTLEAVKLLLSAGADVSIKDFEGRDAIWWAQSKERHEIVKLLLSKKQ